MVEPFIVSLLNGSSPLFRFICVNWQRERGVGHYDFTIHSPNVIHRLLFGKQTMEG